MQSAPVLMIPETYPFVYLYGWGDGEGGTLNNFEVIYAMCSGTLLYNVLSSSVLQELSNWSDIVVSVDIFVSPLLYLYDSNGSVEKLIKPDYNHLNNRPNVNTDHYHVPFIGIGNWTHNDGEYKEYWMQKNISNFVYEFYGLSQYNGYPYKATVPLKAITAEQIEDTIVNETRFYKISSINISELESTLSIVPMKAR